MAEGYKIGDIFVNQYSFLKYVVKDIQEDYVEVDIKEHDTLITENQIIQKPYFDSKIYEGVLTKVENVLCGTIDNNNIYDSSNLFVQGTHHIKLDGSTIQLKEMVNHPKHYNTGKYEVIDVIEDWDLNFALGNAVKYIARCNYKENKLQDLKKALWYLQHEIDKIEKGGVQ